MQRNSISLDPGSRKKSINRNLSQYVSNVGINRKDLFKTVLNIFKILKDSISGKIETERTKVNSRMKK